MSDNTTRLLSIMAKLRDPDTGCPWDIEQDFESIAPYTIEEAYEVADAISREDFKDLKSELGDLLFQVVFHAQMASEIGEFSYEDVAETVSDKMVRRHPHVFANVAVNSADDQIDSWEEIKAQERSGSADTSILADIPIALPELARAEKLQKRAARAGFDWNSPEQVIDKIKEEVSEIELEGVKAISGNLDGIIDEVGDLLFTCANLARKWGVNPETALRRGNEKFEKRFRAMESYFEKRGQKMSNLDLSELESAWSIVKLAEEKEKYH